MKRKICLFFLLFTSIAFSDFQTFGGWSISEKLFNYIKENLEEGSCILELGSGWASGELSNFYEVHSVEHSLKWINKFDTNYIYAPIKNGWYDLSVLHKELPKDYNLILIDGPPGRIGRMPFFDNLDLFNLDTIIIVDDVQRPTEKLLLQKLSKHLNRPYEIHQCNDTTPKAFGVIKP